MENRFETGMLYFTNRVDKHVALDPAFAKHVMKSIKRHIACDWSEMSEEDRETNTIAMKDGSRIFSAYGKKTNKIWIITEADRLTTTVLFPSEY